MVMSHAIIVMYNPPFSLIFSHFTEIFVVNKPFTFKIYIANGQMNYALIISFIH